MKATKASAVGACSKSGEQRATMNTPAVTMVAAWIRAETGVGPSMASGSQVCRPSWADLPMAPTNSSRQMTLSVPKLWLNTRRLVSANLPASPNTVSNSTESNTR